MKPISLRLQNIGPFLNQEIDFSRLDDMFLICGKTGAGKSTIFTAMTYALYGKLAGSQQLGGRHIRSDFAPPDADATIILDFILQENRYRVRRTLVQARKTKKGGVTEQNETVELSKADGDEFLLLSNGKSETDKLIESLIGLTVDEFSCIILLPQGEFAAFLKQPSSERRKTLAKLFPIGEYEQLTELAKENSNQAECRLKIILDDLQTYGDFDCHQQEQILAEHEVVLRHNKERQKSLQEAITQTELEKSRQQIQLDNFIEHQKFREAFARHKDKEPEVKIRRQQLGEAERAISPHAKIQDWRKATAMEGEATAQLNATQTAVQTATETLKKLQSRENEFLQLRRRREGNLGLRQELNQAAATEAEFNQKTAALAAEKIELDKIQQELNQLDLEKGRLEEELAGLETVSIQDTDAINEQLMQVRDEINEGTAKVAAARNYQTKQEEAKTAEAELEAAREQEAAAKERLQAEREKLAALQEKNYAQLLAQNLQPGKPCPVCGSTSHTHSPHQQLSLIHEEDDLSPQKEVVEQLEQDWNEAVSRRSRTEAELTRIRQQLEESGELPSPEAAESELATLETKQAELLAAQTSVRTTITRQQQLEDNLKTCRNRMEPLQKQREETDRGLTHLSGQLQEQEKVLRQAREAAQQAGFSGGSVQEILAKIKNWLNAADVELETYENDRQRAQTALSAGEARLQEQENMAQQRRREAEAAGAEMERSLQDANFASAEAAEKAYLAHEAMQKIRGEIESWTQECTRLETMVAEAAKKLSGTRQEAEDRLRELEAAGSELQAQLDELERRHQATLQEFQQRQSDVNTWKELESRRKTVQAEARLFKRFYEDISDKNPKKIALTTWILGVYMDQIVLYANQRLARISEGRYTLILATEKGGGKAKVKGLDLEVMDAYTGKQRPCPTLSGGETFMVSLSLALGLTDVIVSRRGGSFLQSLFIDEGFGSLDPASLDKALSILEEVREGRCVGVISHVEEMKNRIPSRLEVIKTATGSAVELVEE